LASPAGGSGATPSAAPSTGGNPLKPIIVTGTDLGDPAGPLVKVWDATTGQLEFQFLAYPASFLGGVRVAAADLTGDGIPDIVTSPGPGLPAEIKVWDGQTGAQLPGPAGDFLAYDRSFLGGAFVAAADTNGDGTPDIITGPGAGGGSEIRSFSGKEGSLLSAFAAYPSGYQLGVPVAAGYWPGMGHAFVIAGSGPGSGEVRVLDPQSGAQIAGPAGDLHPYGSSYYGGVWVALADVEGNGTADILTGAGVGHTPEVKVISGVTGTVLRDFLAATSPSDHTGVRVAATYISSTTDTDFVTVGGPGSVPRVNVYSGTTSQLLPPPEDGFLAYQSHNGAFVAAAIDPSVTVTLTPATMTLATGATATLTANWTSDIPYLIATGSTSIVWGDGTFTPFVPGAPSGSYTASHTYSSSGCYIDGASVALIGPSGAAYGGALGHVYVGTTCIPVIPPTDDCACSGSGGSLVKNAAGQGGGNGPGGAGGPMWTEAPIRYADGTIKLGATDLSSAGFGVPWGQARSWSNALGYTIGSDNGNGWVDTQQPRLLQADGHTSNTVILVTNATTSRFYDLVSGSYVPRFYDQSQLAHNTTTHEFVLLDASGNQLTFADFDSSVTAAERGALKSFVDPDGNTTSVTSWTTDGHPAEVQRSTTRGSDTITESYLYSYVSSGVNGGLLSGVVLRRRINSGSWSTVRQVQYTYYDGNASVYGNIGDLDTAQILDASSNVLDTYYYRYYTSADAGSIGYVGGLKYAFGPQSYGRLVTALGSTAPGAAGDSDVAPYADNYFQYDSHQRVTEEIAQGAGCSACTGGLGTYTYSYTASTNTAGFNSWAMKTTETLPDSNQNVVYTNAYGEVMLKAYTDETTSQTWDTFYKYDSQGHLILQASPSAVTGYDDSDADLLHSVSGNYQYLSDSTGLVTLFDYASSTTAGETTAGSAAGYQEDTQVQQGETGTAGLQSSTQYFKHAASSSTVYPVATQTVYRNTDGTGGETTSFSYTWFSGTTQMQSVAVSKPVVSSAENGPGTADVDTTYFDVYARPIWEKDPDGFLTYTAYDPATGAVIKNIDDVNTSNTSDFTNLPSGWSTPSGGGLHLITTMQVDALGRTTETTDPNGNVTYTVYDDPDHAMRVYPGWNSSTGTPTGPTQVTREDRPGGYTETLTMSATPHLTSGVPDGTEAIGSVQSLSRQYTNAAGQMVRQDAYFNLSGVTYSTTASIGTVNTNYYSTLYDYDERGRPNRTQLPTGTIQRTVYDGLGRMVSTWVGTNDTPSLGEWSPTNNTSPANMVQVSGDVYDGGGVGDGNLTQRTQYPGGSAANRVTQNYYDWRDRLVATKSGVQTTEDTTTHRPILYYTLDNLGETTQVQQYDGDGVTLTSSGGVPQPPSSSLLRAQAGSSFDDQGRVYQTRVYSVDPSTGSVSSTALTTNTWFNHRGFTIKTSQPGGLVTKDQYDGAGRLTVTYTTDGNGDAAPGATNNWANAGTVSSSNNVLVQGESTYDSDGNTILTATRQRNHDEATGGALGNPTTTPRARVSFLADYYDAANRLTTQVDVGTNGGTAWTRPTSPPSASDTVLVTSTGYGADSVQQVQLTGTPTGGTFTLTFNGQTTSSIAYNASAATVQSAVQGLSSIGSGNALVAGGIGGPWQVRFVGTLGGSVRPALTGNGSGLTGGTSPTVALTITSLGGDAGHVQQMTDPRGIVTRTDYDWLGRTLRTVEAFSAFNPSNNADKTTEYTYDGSNHVLSLQADLVAGAHEQTSYVYGVTTSSGSNINSNDILAATQYPDPTTGNASSGQQETYTVNALGERTGFTDRNGNVHAYIYDVLGRLTSDQVTTLGSGVDGAVQRLDTAYDTQGNPYLFTSYSTPSATTVVNQVERAFNGLGQLIQEWQSHSGAVNTSTTPSVQYTYSLMASGANHSRLTSIVYPGTGSAAKTVSYVYNSGLDDAISRLSSLSDGTNTLESYTYLGLDTVVKRAHPQPGVDLTYIKQTGESNGDAGDQYTGLDRFGRVVDQRWLVSSTGTATDRFQYGYDRDGNVLFKNNLVNTSFGELYHASGAGNGYDNLNQLTDFASGVLSASVSGGPLDTVASPTHSQNWSLDAAGNFTSVTTDSTATSRTENKQNEVTQVGAASLGFDSNGNTITDNSGKTLVYDAWNRLVAYKSGSTTLENAQYDALRRRIVQNPGTAVDLYYSSAWQVLEERAGSATQAQYVWSPVYVDALIERDRASDRLYAQQDPNWNVTAAVSTTGTVLERYIYDPYGSASFLDAAWAPLPSSAYQWVYTHQGGRLDTISGLYSFRTRNYSPSLQRWIEPDPIGYMGHETNLYRYLRDNPLTTVDPLGKEPRPIRVCSGEDVYFDFGGGDEGAFRIHGDDLLITVNLSHPCWTCKELVEWIGLTTDSLANRIDDRVGRIARGRPVDPWGSGHPERIVQEAAFLARLWTEFNNRCKNQPKPPFYLKQVQVDFLENNNVVLPPTGVQRPIKQQPTGPTSVQPPANPPHLPWLPVLPDIVTEGGGAAASSGSGGSAASEAAASTGAMAAFWWMFIIMPRPTLEINLPNQWHTNRCDGPLT
jgi:RHS repeat-associated protein